MKALSIGTLSRATGVKIPTIRYYESIGVMPAVSRSQSNRRQYDEKALNRLRFIRHARELGFDIPAIKELVNLADQPQRSCAKVDRLARHHLHSIESRIERLTALKVEMESMIKACAKNRIADCRVIDVLSKHQHCSHPEPERFR